MVVQSYIMSWKHAKANVGFSDLLKIMNTYVTAHSVIMAENAAPCSSAYACRRSLKIVHVLSIYGVKVFYAPYTFIVVRVS